MRFDHLSWQTGRVVGLIVALLVTAGWATAEPKPAARTAMVIVPDRANVLTFPPIEARFVRLLLQTANEPPCIDELEIYGPEGQHNLALARHGAKATASSCLPGYVIHQVAHLNDGLYGNDHSWIAATPGPEWAQIELPRPARVARVVISRDRKGQYNDRLPIDLAVQVSPDGKTWQTVKTVKNSTAAWHNPYSGAIPPVALPSPPTWEGLLRYAFLCERAAWEVLPGQDHLSPLRVDRPALPGGPPYWSGLARLEPIARTLRQMDDLIDRLAIRGLDLAAERAQRASLQRRLAELNTSADNDLAAEALYLEARLAKRRLFFRDPDLAPLTRILFVKRYPYEPSHNYSDYLDSKFQGGGGICVLEMPRRDGRLEPSEGRLTTLFDARSGIPRDPVASFDARQITFAYRPAGPRGEAYWHLMTMRADGNDLRQLTDGPFHDYYPYPLPDGGLAFVSTRCQARFLCWVPMSCVLYRMDADGTHLRPLSHANLSEWGPSILRDGRILWTRSEYLDKGADFGHTLWTIHPDGTHPALAFGNDTLNCYMNGHEMPGTSELCCTLIAHGGDFNGPIGLIDISKGPFNQEAITNITPDVRPRYHMDWARTVCFRDPVPISRDHILVSHAPADRFGLYVIDRYGNRELLYLDPAIGSMSPTPLRPVPRPPVLPSVQQSDGAGPAEGQFVLSNVYQGLGAAVAPGSVKYLRVCQEVRADLERLPGGKCREEYPPFEDYYAAPTHKVTGPYGWPSFVAKGDYGIVPVEKDGSARFFAPAGKVLYFQVLDEHYNEIQRMRSVVQVQPGEVRSCVGCHDDRTGAPPARAPLAMHQPPRRLQPPSWGAGPFSYEKVVQPVWEAHCVRCHDARDKKGLNFTGILDADHVPASYRTLISQGWVHYFTYMWGAEHRKAEALTFGTRQSKLWKVLEAGHHDVKLTADERERIKCWTDLNCPLWPDYQYRLTRR